MSSTASVVSARRADGATRAGRAGRATVAAVLDQQRRLLAAGRARLVADSLPRLLADPVSDEERCEGLALLVEACLAHGDLSAAERAGRLIERTPGATRHAMLFREFAQGEIAAATDRPEEALACFRRAGVAACSGNGASSEPPWRPALALALLRAGHTADALVIAEEHHLVALADAEPVALALSLRTLATVAPDGRAVERLRAALELLDHPGAAGAGRLRAQIQTDLGALLALGGERADAVLPLRSAEEFAGRFALWPLLARVRRVLDHLDESPRQVDAASLSALTAGERRVVLRAVDGMTNRAIATALGVSIKAVEGHLSRAYRKLGVSSRAQLTVALRGPG